MNEFGHICCIYDNCTLVINNNQKVGSTILQKYFHISMIDTLVTSEYFWSEYDGPINEFGYICYINVNCM